MKYPFTYPHVIENPFGERLIFEFVEDENGIKKMYVSNEVQPGAGPPFHVHFKQDEYLTVVKGKMGYQIEGEAEKYLLPGASVLFEKGQMHRFWNAGEHVLTCKGWVKPANTFDYFITGIYNSMNKAGKSEGDPFDSAFLMTRYRSEYDLKDIPGFVKAVIFPITTVIGKIMGKYDHFKDAPPPLR